MRSLHEFSLHRRVLALLDAPCSVYYKAFELNTLLLMSQPQEIGTINAIVPGLNRTLFQHCVLTLKDHELDMIHLLLHYADLDQRDTQGQSVFDLLVPLQWDKLSIFLALLEWLNDPDRVCIILKTAIRAGSVHEARLLERLRMARLELETKQTSHHSHAQFTVLQEV